MGRLWRFFWPTFGTESATRRCSSDERFSLQRFILLLSLLDTGVGAGRGLLALLLMLELIA